MGERDRNIERQNEVKVYNSTILNKDRTLNNEIVTEFR